MKITGGCHCGKIKFEAEADKANVVICHCTDCQMLSGSAFRSIVVTDEDAFRFTSGTPKKYIKTGDSGNQREQTFCSHCGSPIYSASAGEVHRSYAIRLGTVDQRNELEPRTQIWHRSAQKWISQISMLPAEDKE